jgi:hypothetical protein
LIFCLPLTEAIRVGAEALAHAARAFDLLKSSNVSSEDRRDLYLRYLDILHERSAEVSTINKIQLEVYNMASHGGGSGGANKREMDDASPFRASKEPRTGAPPTNAAAPVAAPYGVGAGYGGAAVAGYAPIAAPVGGGYGAPVGGQGYGYGQVRPVMFLGLLTTSVG